MSVYFLYRLTWLHAISAPYLARTSVGQECLRGISETGYSALDNEGFSLARLNSISTAICVDQPLFTEQFVVQLILQSV
jgi:hypothetical protein